MGKPFEHWNIYDNKEIYIEVVFLNPQLLAADTIYYY
jgi:hypothetical protein